MANKEIVLKIKSDKIWCNDSYFIELKKTNIPHEHLLFKTFPDIYWKVSMLAFDKTTKKLKVEVNDYNCSDLNSFINQKPKQEIKQLEFGMFNWKFLEPQLSSYQKSKFIDRLTHTDENVAEQEDFVIKSKRKKVTRESNEVINKDGHFVTKFEEEFAIDFNDSVFMLGYVGFSKYIKKLQQSVDFKIQNDNILAEFDNIKFWFSKKLKIKKFKVKAVFTIVDDLLNEFSATSQDINKIDRNLIEGVKIQRTLAITTTIRPREMDKALFTSEDLFSLENTNDLEGNVFKQTEKDILDMLMEKSDVRNKRELTYLSGRKQSINYKIRFSNYPNFGFIFLAEGELNNHYIWELLNSHATYIWTIEKGYKEIDLQYRRIEVIINTILHLGREKYKHAYKTTMQDNDLIFNVIHHKGKGSQLKDEFPKWKHRLNQLIT